MWDGSRSRVADAETSHGDDGSALDEFGTNIFIGDIQHGRVEDGTTVVHLDWEWKREWVEAEIPEKWTYL